MEMACLGPVPMPAHRVHPRVPPQRLPASSTTYTESTPSRRIAMRPGMKVIMGALIAVAVVPSLAAAQAPPAPTPDAVAPAPPPPPPPPTETDYWKANAQAGVLWLSGNSNSLALSAGAVVARDDK